ncbi:Transmembrane and TPR repeat-containing protein 4 [Phytophthora cinnamomi]|uniref:Transmembrane and TPR repeat-containing protein 4 n=1 Tax=Phytophthora cinnamomi TaxID=4785 RepID=UPI0035593A04|nr:Transmembrane and TPR repeat-containing protein 4 [Phytophthora cinnamomi]
MLLDVSPREASALLVFLAALLTAWTANGNGFVWDDRSAVLANEDAQSSGLGDVFAHDFWGTHIRSARSHKSYRPLAVLSFRLNFLLAGGHSAWLYHCTNALVHAACSVLVWTVADELFQQHERRLAVDRGNENPQDASPTAANGETKAAIGGEGGALVGPVTAGLLFAVHPIHCDAVASIVGRADLLCTALCLLAFLAYAREAGGGGVQWTGVALALALTIAAGLCKELGFTNFALLVAYDLLRIHHYQSVAGGMQLMKRRIGVTVDPELLVEASSIYNMLGVCYRKKGDADTALEMLRKGIALYPEETDLHINAAMILLHQGKQMEADAQLKAGLIAATLPGHIQKLRNIAKMLEVSKMEKAVEVILDRAAALERQYSGS